MRAKRLGQTHPTSPRSPRSPNPPTFGRGNPQPGACGAGQGRVAVPGKCHPCSVPPGRARLPCGDPGGWESCWHRAQLRSQTQPAPDFPAAPSAPSSGQSQSRAAAAEPRFQLHRGWSNSKGKGGNVFLLLCCRRWRGHGTGGVPAVPGSCPAPPGGKAKISWVPEPGAPLVPCSGSGCPVLGGGMCLDSGELGHGGQLGDTELVALGQQRLECASWRLLCSRARCPRHPAHPEGIGNAQGPWHSGGGARGTGGAQGTGGCPAHGHSVSLFRLAAGWSRGQDKGSSGKQGRGSGPPKQGTAKGKGSRSPWPCSGGLRDRDHPEAAPGKGRDWWGFVTSRCLMVGLVPEI